MKATILEESEIGRRNEEKRAWPESVSNHGSRGMVAVNRWHGGGEEKSCQMTK